MSFYVVDIEADAPTPMTGSMVCFGAVKVTDELNETFYGETAPISDHYVQQALDVSGFSRKEHERFDNHLDVMPKFAEWIRDTNEGNNATFMSDNLAFDWMWIAGYFDVCGIKNPFGFSGRRIGDLYCGYVKNIKKNKEWKRKFRKTKHTHDPVDDAKGNAEALLAMRDMGLNFKFI